jgi:formylglycine-generating enzyme required for sulfatase activity
MDKIIEPPKSVPGRSKISLPVIVVVGVLLSALAVLAMNPTAIPKAVPTPSPTPVSTATPTTQTKLVAAITATKDRPYVNELQMKFVPVPGTNVLFSVWETRCRDFAEYARQKPYEQLGGIHTLHVEKNDAGNYVASFKVDSDASWQEPGFSQTEENPVVGVSWNEAREFCEWLTQLERDGGRLGPRQRYRLPTDAEWSAAVGPSKYPWGDKWPPPTGAGNYFDEAGTESLPCSNCEHVPGNDGFTETSPVGYFLENRFGLFDLGGNAREWCEDEYRASMNTSKARAAFPALKDERTSDGTPLRVHRGGSWYDGERDHLLSSLRGNGRPSGRFPTVGFRVVLANDLSP